MRQSLYFNSFLAMLLFVAHLNCVVEHKLFALSELNVERSLAFEIDGYPVGPEDGDCHEIGCICEGATLADHVVLIESDFSQFFAADLDLAPRFSQFAITRVGEHFSSDDSIPDLSLRAIQRCAVIQSFQI